MPSLGFCFQDLRWEKREAGGEERETGRESEATGTRMNCLYIRVNMRSTYRLNPKFSPSLILIITPLRYKGKEGVCVRQGGGSVCAYICRCMQIQP